ncbi:MAG: wax ester/triacylglycerol synthase family O-acyltransferase [Acidimicrobiales bacterium]
MQRLTGVDAMFIYGEASGWPLHMGALGLFDPSMSPAGLDVERVRELFRQRLPHLGPFRHRLVRAPAGLDRPVWVEDPDVDVTEHIRGVRVPAPGTRRQVAELVADLYAPRLDLAEPLWEKWVIEGIEGGLVGILDCIHHAAIDAVRAIEVQAASYDIDPAAPFARPGGSPVIGERAPMGAELLGGAALRLASTPVRALAAAGHLAGAGGRLVGAMRRGEHEGLALPFTAPRTSLNAAVTKRRAFAYCSLSLGDVKEIARREHVTVNDVVLTLTGGALRSYLDERGELPRRSLTAGVPVGLADQAGARPVGGNQLALTLASLGTDVVDPVERLRKVAASARAGKAMLRAIGPELMMELVGLAPPAAVGVSAAGYAGLGLVRVHPPVVNVVVSNVRGAPMPLYLAGARLTATYPIGPIADGLGLNVTVISYLDSLDFGLTVCPDLVEDPWCLVGAFEAAAAELAPRDGRRRHLRARTPTRTPARRVRPSGAGLGTEA